MTASLLLTLPANLTATWLPIILAGFGRFYPRRWYIQLKTCLIS